MEAYLGRISPKQSNERKETMLNKTTVKDIIKARGSRFCTVTFKTNAGEKRKVNGQLRKPTEAQVNHWLQPIYNVHTKKMASFYWTDVEEIN